ncbi:MAG: M28 family peptidase [Pedosphaera sp.]|nr:M28 family peptidase [Pedosphaera sp.]
MTGAVEAARVGAVASLIRSVTDFSLQTPHTGMMQYDPAVPKIPHAALTPEDTDHLERWQKEGKTVRIHLTMQARQEADTSSRNIIAEIPGREHPEELVVVGGHIDSWDVGQGAQDDGGGCVAAWEVLRLIRERGFDHAGRFDAYCGQTKKTGSGEHGRIEISIDPKWPCMWPPLKPTPGPMLHWDSASPVVMRLLFSWDPSVDCSKVVSRQEN